MKNEKLRDRRPDNIFEAYDCLNDKPINLFKIIIGPDGKAIAVEDMDGEIYGLHQALLTIFHTKEELEKSTSL